MQNKHAVHFAEQGTKIINDIVFPLRNHLKGLPLYMKNGGQITEGMQVLCERGMRAQMEPGTVLSWEMKTVVYDITKLGKYGECIAQVRNNKTGNVAAWPFTMLYVNEQNG